MACGSAAPPDGKRVAFTRVNVDEKRTGYETSIWTVATDGSDLPVRMTNGKHDAAPRWSPDGKQIAFIRSGVKDESGKPKPPQIALLSLEGGEARILTDLPKGAGGAIWSPDGKQMAFSSTTTSEDIEKAGHKKQPGEEDEHESDVHIISRAVYRSNGEGYLDAKRHEHIWVLNLPRQRTRCPSRSSLLAGNSMKAMWFGAKMARVFTF